MNFLAHLLLSGNDVEIMVGNFIADWIKGKAVLQYPLKIQQGIFLHRFIDDITDNHHITLLSRNRVRPVYSKYSGIVIDMFYDHFLAVNWNKFSLLHFHKFIENSHKSMWENRDIMPEKVQQILPRIIANKRLESYSTIEGMENALQTMSQYSSLPANTKAGIDILKEQYSEFNNEFLTFFPELFNAVRTKLG